MQWNPDLYEQFRRHRERPAWDLIQQISAENPRLIYDLGCGTGRVTTWLAERYPNAQVVGVDISESMLAEARSKDQPSNLRFELADLTTWQPTEKPDVIFSNSTLHWLEDHEHCIGPAGRVSAFWRSVFDASAPQLRRARSSGHQAGGARWPVGSEPDSALEGHTGE